MKKIDKEQIMLENFIEEQRKFNKLINKQNKRIRNTIIFLTVFILVLSSITAVASYTFNINEADSSLAKLRPIGNSSLVGNIFSYMGTSTPFGFLECDGTIYNINDYPRLADHINKNFGATNYFGGDGETTFAVPDLRGEFLRGTGTNTHAYGGVGAAVGVHQEPTRSPNIISGSNRLSIIGTSSIYNADSTQGKSKLNYITASSPTDHYYANYYTSRPTNTSVLYIIKY